jgi:heat shock protein HslJ
MHKFAVYILALGVATTALSACSLFKKETKAAEQVVDVMPLYPIVSAEKVEQKSNVGIAGKWYVRTVGSMTLSGIEDDQWPYLDFVESEKRFYGTNGCNILNGEYRIVSPDSLSLINVASTMRLCPSDSLSYPMNLAINAVAAYSVTKSKKGITLLALKDNQNKVVMTLSKSDIDFLNGAWQVVAVNGKEVDVKEARLIFDTIEGHISGNAGCNSLRGVLSRNPKVENSIQISDLITTRMACPNLATESALLIALEETLDAKVDGDEHVILTDAAGRVLVKLKRLQRSDF